MDMQAVVRPSMEMVLYQPKTDNFSRDDFSRDDFGGRKTDPLPCIGVHIRNVNIDCPMEFHPLDYLESLSFPRSIATPDSVEVDGITFTFGKSNDSDNKPMTAEHARYVCEKSAFLYLSILRYGLMKDTMSEPYKQNAKNAILACPVLSSSNTRSMTSFVCDHCTLDETKTVIDKCDKPTLLQHACETDQHDLFDYLLSIGVVPTAFMLERSCGTVRTTLVNMG